MMGSLGRHRDRLARKEEKLVIRARIMPKCCLALAILSIPAVSGLSTPHGNSILRGRVHAMSFSRVHRAVDELYRRSPGIRGYTSPDGLQYSAHARNVVLGDCRRGSPLARTIQELESSKALACLPLIIYYYSYGTHRSVHESVRVARDIYWFAAMELRHPENMVPAMRRYLRAEGVT